MAITEATRTRVRDDIVRLVHRGLGVSEFARALAPILRRAVPFDGWCLLTVDPASLLPTGEVVENALPADTMVRLTEIELREPDFNKFTALARAERSAASLSDVTEGDLDQSLRQRELRRPSGFADELRAACTGVTGTWGALTLLREEKRPLFSSRDVRFVASLAEPLSDGLRRAAIFDDPPTGDDEVGMLVLAPDKSIAMSNRAADRLLDELRAGGRPGIELPIVVGAVAARAHGGLDNALARARVRTAAGRWLVVRGSALGEGPDAPVAILLEAAHRPELAPLVADAYGLTERERLVTELVAQGFPTSAIADRLQVSAYTVQDHLKAIFAKSGTSSRGDLVARLFFDHYAPRLTTPTDLS